MSGFLIHRRDTGYRSVDELPAGADDYDAKYEYPHCPVFKEIGELRGPFDLGLIPIGAYDPRWIMSPMHANPFDSVNIFVDTKCRRALGIHWGTWVLTEEAANSLTANSRHRRHRRHWLRSYRHCLPLQ